MLVWFQNNHCCLSSISSYFTHEARLSLHSRSVNKLYFHHVRQSINWIKNTFESFFAGCMMLSVERGILFLLIIQRRKVLWTALKYLSTLSNTLASISELIFLTSPNKLKKITRWFDFEPCNGITFFSFSVENVISFFPPYN